MMQRFTVLRRLSSETPLLQIPAGGVVTLRALSGLVGELKDAENKNVSPFRNMLKSRRDEANKSFLIQVHSEQSCANLYSYIKKVCLVKEMFHFQSPTNSHFVLIELSKEEDISSVYEHAIHFQPHEVVPVRSPFLWFRTGPNESVSSKHAPFDKISYHNVISIEDKDKIENYLLNAESISQQMFLLFDKIKITEIGTRLRFLTAKQLEMGLTGLFPDLSILPFGSSVNGFGKNDCDLDLVLIYSDKIQKDKSRLIYHAKSSLINERIQIQHHIEIIADIVQLFMPGCTSIRKILQARVPIFKFKQDLTGLECDVCMANDSAIQMSELLYMFSQSDQRVQVLIFSVRYWAHCVGLTNPSPGRWISNFSLTLLVLYFLQKKQILPKLDKLGTSCQPQMELSTEKLLKDFFEFYSDFDFSSNAVSLLTGNLVIKPDYSALYIVNPLQPELNVSKNVSFEEVEHLKIEMRIGLEILNDFGEMKDGNWGLVKLFKRNPSNNLKSKPRLLNVQSLFDEETSVLKKDS